MLKIISNALDGVDNSTLALAALAAGTAYGLKVYAGGRRNIWERDWTGGKLIMIVADATPTTLALIDTLLRLPLPPNILFLPPALPTPLLTVLHTLRLASSSPHAALHAEALPRTPAGIRAFVRKWAGAPMGTVGEGGRRVDAIVLGGAWECAVPPESPLDPAQDPEWTPAQFHFHLVTALLPSLMRAPPERDLRIVQLVSPAWAGAMPGIQAGIEGRPRAPDTGLAAAAARRGATSLLLQTHLALVLDTLASAAYAKKPAVPDPEGKVAKRVSLQSNILALSVIMPWARDEVVRPLWTGVWAILYILLLPFIVLLTPGPAQAVQGVLHALSAPVKFPGEEGEGEESTALVKQSAEEGEKAGDAKATRDPDEVTDPRRNGVRQGDVIRGCAVIDIPPVLRDPLLARATYEKLESEVEAGVRASEAREKAYGNKEKSEKGGEKNKSEEKPETQATK